MAYEPKHKVGDSISLTGQVLAIVSFKRDGFDDAEPMYMIWTNHSWFWAWAESVDNPSKPGGDPDPPPWPPGTPGG